MSRNKVIDYVEYEAANIDLTRNLFQNQYPGLKLAGGLAYAPIIVPVWFMGIPLPEPEDKNDEKTKTFLEGLIKQFADTFAQIHKESHRDGTCWIWPHYSSKTMQLVWEFIPDDSITDIFKDIDTAEVVKIVTEETINLTVGLNALAIVRRRRTFTAQEVITEWMQ
jgi:hypothetical protein